jgi:hypothetical protein
MLKDLTIFKKLSNLLNIKKWIFLYVFENNARYKCVCFMKKFHLYLIYQFVFFKTNHS